MSDANPLEQLKALTGVGGTVTLGGRTFVARQATLDDIATFTAWAREQLIQRSSLLAVVRRELDLFPPKYHRLVMDSAMERLHRDLDPGSPAAMGLLDRLDSSAMMLWLLVRHEQPAETFESIRGLLAATKIDLAALAEQLAEVSGLKGALPENPPDQGANPPAGPSPGGESAAT